MKKILFQLNELGFGGTTKAVLSFCSHLDRTQFEPYLFFHTDQGTWKQWERKISSYLSQSKANRYHELYVKNFSRQKVFQKILGVERISQGQAPAFLEMLKYVQPDIVHFNRGDSEDWYTSLDLKSHAPIRFVETNIFGKSSPPQYLQSLSRVFFISQWLKERSPWCQDAGRILANPILKPQSLENLRSELRIANEAFVVGRVSRPGLDNGIQAYEIFKAQAAPDDIYLVVGASNEILQLAKSDLRIRAFASSTDEIWLSKFYNTMDVLLHYRLEGETFGMNIAEAMIHGKPIVSHRSFLDNAHYELILPGTPLACGDIVEQNQFLQQSKLIFNLKEDRVLREKWGQNAKRRSLENCEAGAVTRNLEKQYLEILDG